MVLVAFLVFQGSASAKMVSGKLLGVDTTAKSLSLNTIDPATGSEKKVDVMVSGSTTYSGMGIKAIEDLKAGQEVWVDAEEDIATGNWKATSVKVADKMAEKPASEKAAEKPM